MLTSLSLTHLLVISAAYLLLLFGLAWLTERGLIPERMVRNPLTYTLSVGVYASAWAFYGTIGLAYQYGYGYLATYLGISGAFLLGPVLLHPILRLTRTYQLSSLADLFAFRFRSPWSGSLTTLVMLLCMLPLLALQIQAIADTVGILTRAPQAERIALVYCILIMLFTMLFGARHIASQEKHEGLVLAIAFESLVKLVALVVISLYVLFVVFDGPDALNTWLQQNQDALAALHTPLQEGPWRTMLLVFFSAALVTPHMYHMAFTESVGSRCMTSASWGLPLFLLLMSLAVPLLLWSGLKLGVPTPPEYFTIGLGMVLNSEPLALLAFIGGLSASSGLIIVSTLAISGMVLNHLVLPLYQPPAEGDIYRWLRWTRRALIVAIIMAGYGFFRVLDGHHDLTGLGSVAYAGTLQFLPGVLSTLYWPTANRRGYIAGLLTGITVWTLCMLLPLVCPQQTLWLPWTGAFSALDENTWHTAAVASLALNVLVFSLVSLFTRSSAEETRAAEACAVENMRLAQRRELVALSPREFAEALARPLGSSTAQAEVEKALTELQLPFNERRPYALRRLRDRIEANLSGLMGPSIAQDIVKNCLPYKDSSNSLVSEDIHYIESRIEEYRSRLTGLAAELDALRRYHRQTLQDLPMGVCSLARDQEILMWNRAMEQLTTIPADQVVGSCLSALDQPWGGLLEHFVRLPDSHLHKQRLEQDDQSRWLNLHKAAIDEPLAPGNTGLVLLVEDCTETQLLEEHLIHSERLASIGRLAAGVAHEIGNPVTGIACLAQNLRDERAQDADIREASSQIIEQTRRITKIVQSLMGFAHAGTHQPWCTLSLSAITQEAIALLSLNRQGTEVCFINQCNPLHETSGDPQRLVQVLINLISNARDASPAGGVIRIRSTSSASSVQLIVEDEGSGISRTIQKRLFEPFFTTKDPGKGTGLGLALVYSIVEEHHGRIDIESPTDPERGLGTRVRITLPRHAGSHPAAA